MDVVGRDGEGELFLEAAGEEAGVVKVWEPCILLDVLVLLLWGSILHERRGRRGGELVTEPDGGFRVLLEVDEEDEDGGSFCSADAPLLVHGGLALCVAELAALVSALELALDSLEPAGGCFCLDDSSSGLIPQLAFGSAF